LSRGWVEKPALLAHEDAVADAVERALRKALDGGETDLEKLNQTTRRAAGQTVSDRTRRRPMIVPMVREG
jgi:ribonuclease J